MSKTVLVICSSPDGVDYPAKDNQDILNSVLGKEFTPTFLPGGESKSFPEDLPPGKHQFDLIFFAGCNTLESLFQRSRNKKGVIDRLPLLLKKDGRIIFSESPSYVKKLGEQGHGRTLTIEGLYNHPVMKNGFKKAYAPTVAHWNKVFQRSDSGIYVAYALASGAAKKSEPLVSGMSEDLDCDRLIVIIQEYLDTYEGASFGNMVSYLMADSDAKAIFEKYQISIPKRQNKTAKRGARPKPMPGCGKLLDILEDPALAFADKLERIKRLISSSGSNSNNSAATPLGEPPQEEWEMGTSKTTGKPVYVLRDETGKIIQKAWSLPPGAILKGANTRAALIAKAAAEGTPAKGVAAVFFAGFDVTLEENRSMERLNAAIGALLPGVYTPAVEASKVLKQGHPGGIPRDQDEFPFECQEEIFTVESMNASGKNSDCLFHSFLTTTCSEYRRLKALGTPKARKLYETFATQFRTILLPKLVDYSFEHNPKFTGKIYTDEGGNEHLLQKQLKAELAAPGAFVQDFMINVVSYYFQIRFICVTPGPVPEFRKAYLVDEGLEDHPYDHIYALSNSAQDESSSSHWEPMRMTSQGGVLYEFTAAQLKCFTEAYPGQPDMDRESDEIRFLRLFKEMPKIVALKADHPERIAAFISNETNEHGVAYPKDEEGHSYYMSGATKSLVDNTPGAVTQLYIQDHPVVSKLQEYIELLTGLKPGQSRDDRERIDEAIEMLQQEQVRCLPLDESIRTSGTWPEDEETSVGELGDLIDSIDEFLRTFTGEEEEEEHGGGRRKTRRKRKEPKRKTRGRR